jgi:hypothetical protein
MTNPKEDIKRLNKRALRITPTTILMPLALASTKIIEHTMRQASRSHVLTSRQERPQLVEEHMWVVLFIHPLQRASQVL